VNVSSDSSGQKQANLKVGNQGWQSGLAIRVGNQGWQSGLAIRVGNSGLANQGGKSGLANQGGLQMGLPEDPGEPAQRLPRVG
jgi:hypothetical protein